MEAKKEEEANPLKIGPASVAPPQAPSGADDALWRKHGGKVPPGWYEFIDTLSRLRNGNAITAATYAEMRSAGRALAMAAWERGADDMTAAAPVMGMEATSGELAGLPQEVDREARCIHGITGECPQCKAMADRLKERRDQACADYGKGRAWLANVPLTGDSGAPDANPDGIQPGQDSPVRMNPGTGAWDAPDAEVATPALVEASQEGKTPSPSPEGKQQGDA